MISVIAPFFNVEDYLPCCLDSLIHQTYRNLEIILINDGSQDRCPAIAEQYARRDSRIHLIHQRNKGLSESRNIGMLESHGLFLGFVDSDDYIDRNYYEVLYDALARHGADIAIGNKQINHFNVPRLFPAAIPSGETVLSANEALEELVNDQWLCNYVWDKLFKKYLFEGIEFPKGKTFEDVAVMHRIFCRARKIVVTDATTYHYRIRLHSIANSRALVNQYHNFLAHQDRLAFFQEIHRSDLARQEILVMYHLIMEAVLQQVFRSLTDREKAYIGIMETWAKANK